MDKKKKAANAAGVALARLSVKARLKNLTKAQRSDQARRAVQERWRRAKPPAEGKPGRWFGLFELSADREELLCWAYARAVLEAKSRQQPDRALVFFDLQYDPRKLTIQRQFQSPNASEAVKASNTKAQLRALRIALGKEEVS